MALDSSDVSVIRKMINEQSETDKETLGSQFTAALKNQREEIDKNSEGKFVKLEGFDVQVTNTLKSLTQPQKKSLLADIFPWFFE